ncbi:MAG TPA: hypothetical protein VFZ89_04025 [Solirubrobacteraceae bacterium]
MSDPDVTRVGFAATEGPNALVRRHRNPVWGLLCVVLVVGGLAGIVAAILDFSDADVEGDAIARGRVGALDGPETPAVRFTAPERRQYTLWLNTDGVSISERRENVVAATNCAVGYADGGSKRFRGAIQGSSVTLGDHSTVGTFTAPAGTVAISCRQLPFGHYRTRSWLREEHPLLVVAGAPPGDLTSWLLLFGGIGALLLAVLPGSRWLGGSLRRR